MATPLCYIPSLGLSFSRCKERDVGSHLQGPPLLSGSPICPMETQPVGRCDSHTHCRPVSIQWLWEPKEEGYWQDAK